MAYFTKLITENPSWQLAGIYADDGISGTDMKKRDNFNAMMERCLQKDGDIDLILTKSISRFARNTVDCLSCIRKLKERNIAIYFEKEHINTLESTGELLITILSSQAQEESRNISENVKWGLKRKYEKGEMLVRRMFGYGKGTDGQLYIIPEEAEVVRLIYGKYLEGESLNSIARILKEKGIKTIRGNTEWNVNSIRTILINEKYIGDAMAQKTFTIDYLTKTRKENQGELQKYYVENTYEAIIPREVFYKVQEKLHQRANIYKKSSKLKTESKGKHSGKYALSKITICKECGCEYRRQIWSKYGEKKAVWRCENTAAFMPRSIRKILSRRVRNEQIVHIKYEFAAPNSNRCEKNKSSHESKSSGITILKRDKRIFSAECLGIIDTGNALSEPISGLPVIVLGAKRHSEFAQAANVPIPMRTAAGESLLFGLKPKKLLINGCPVEAILAVGAKLDAALVPAVLAVDAARPQRSANLP